VAGASFWARLEVPPSLPERRQADRCGDPEPRLHVLPDPGDLRLQDRTNTADLNIRTQRNRSGPAVRAGLRDDGRSPLNPWRKEGPNLDVTRSGEHRRCTKGDPDGGELRLGSGRPAGPDASLGNDEQLGGSGLLFTSLTGQACERDALRLAALP